MSGKIIQVLTTCLLALAHAEFGEDCRFYAIQQTECPQKVLEDTCSVWTFFMCMFDSWPLPVCKARMNHNELCIPDGKMPDETPTTNSIGWPLRNCNAWTVFRCLKDDKIAYPKLENRRCSTKKTSLQNKQSYITYASLREAEIDCARDVNCHGIYEPGCERGNTERYSTKDNIRLCNDGNAFTEEHDSCVYQKVEDLVLNPGQNCSTSCKLPVKFGTPCNYCGKGLCCKYNEAKPTPGCHKGNGIKGRGFVCSAKLDTPANYGLYFTTEYGQLCKDSENILLNDELECRSKPFGSIFGSWIHYDSANWPDKPKGCLQTNQGDILFNKHATGNRSSKHRQFCINEKSHNSCCLLLLKYPDFVPGITLGTRKWDTKDFTDFNSGRCAGLVGRAAKSNCVLPQTSFDGFCRYGSNNKSVIEDATFGYIEDCFYHCLNMTNCVAYATSNRINNTDVTSIDCRFYEGGPYTKGNSSENATCHVISKETKNAVSNATTPDFYAKPIKLHMWDTMCMSYSSPSSQTPVTLEECAGRVWRECKYYEMFHYSPKQQKCYCINTPGCPKRQKNFFANVYTIGVYSAEALDNGPGCDADADVEEAECLDNAISLGYSLYSQVKYIHKGTWKDLPYGCSVSELDPTAPWKAKLGVSTKYNLANGWGHIIWNDNKNGTTGSEMYKSICKKSQDNTTTSTTASTEIEIIFRMVGSTETIPAGWRLATVKDVNVKQHQRAAQKAIKQEYGIADLADGRISGKHYNYEVTQGSFEVSGNKLLIKPKAEECKDGYTDCRNWASQKEDCTNNAWMAENCRKSCGFCVEDAHWEGPTSNIWSDGQCHNVANMDGNIEECKRACKERPGCTAFNYYSVGKTGCALRRCSMPVTTPSWNNANHEGYHLKAACKTRDGHVGDGTTQGTCSDGERCYADGLCRVKDAHWEGPTSNIWSDDQCPNVGNRDGNIEECKRACTEKPGCTAFNYYSVGRTGCSLRSCSMPVTSPSWKYDNHEGYYLKAVPTTTPIPTTTPAPEYDVMIDNKKETCAREYQLYVRPNHDKEKCEQKCDEYPECMFFFLTDNKWCVLYKECENKRTPKRIGTTYQKNADLWNEESEHMYCTNYKLDFAADQYQCQALCEAITECVGISYSHVYTTFAATLIPCYICYDDHLESYNDLGFYRKIGNEYNSPFLSLFPLLN